MKSVPSPTRAGTDDATGRLASWPAESAEFADGVGAVRKARGLGAGGLASVQPFNSSGIWRAEAGVKSSLFAFVYIRMVEFV